MLVKMPEISSKLFNDVYTSELKTEFEGLHKELDNNMCLPIMIYEFAGEVSMRFTKENNIFKDIKLIKRGSNTNVVITLNNGTERVMSLPKVSKYGEIIILDKVIEVNAILDLQQHGWSARLAYNHKYFGHTSIVKYLSNSYHIFNVKSAITKGLFNFVEKYPKKDISEYLDKRIKSLFWKLKKADYNTLLRANDVTKLYFLMFLYNPKLSYDRDRRAYLDKYYWHVPLFGIGSNRRVFFLYNLNKNNPNFVLAESTIRFMTILKNS